MKKIPFFLLLTVLATATLAQDKKEFAKISKSISDDGKNLDIKVTYRIKGEKQQHYERSIPIDGMSKEDKQALIDRIMDSLGVPNNTPPPPPPKAPEPPKPPKQKRYAVLTPAHFPTLYMKPYA